MPVFLREGPYRFFVVSADRVEPPHVHVRRDDSIAKFWLEPVRLQDRGNFSNMEIRRIQRIVEENQVKFLEDWDECFNR